MLFNCATGLKYPLPEVLNIIDKNNEIDPIDELNNARKKRRRSSASIE